MFIHYSIILIIFKMKKFKVDQNNYNNLFNCIENNLREMGFGDVAVNKKMKDLNKLFYDILLKINTSNDDFRINKNLMTKYFEYLSKNDENWKKFELYFNKFYKFCFDISPKYMLKELKNYKY